MLIQYVKLKTIKTRPTTLWRNAEIKKLKRNCRSAERRWRKTKLTVHYEILRGHLKTYNKTVKQARIAHFQKIINEHRNNQKFLFSTIDLLTNTNFNRSSKTASDALCKDFADHFRGKINDNRSSLLPKRILNVDTPGSLILPKETLESFALVDARTLGRVFSQVKPTTCQLDLIPTPFFKTLCGFFEDQLLYMVNCSLQTGVFAASFKTVVVMPLLKKSDLDPNILQTLIDFKVILLVFKCLTVLGLLTYLTCFYPISPRGPWGPPAPAFCPPQLAAFSLYGPQLWNSLPENLRVAETVEVFKKRLKTHLFNQAFNWFFRFFLIPFMLC